MKMVKNSWNGRIFGSEIYDNMWVLAYFPNGNFPQREGFGQSGSSLVFFKSWTKKLEARFTIKCNELDEFTIGA